MVQIRNLNKSFSNVTVLEDINLTFLPGKIYGIVGRNGSGKTVLFKCICGLLPYEEGQITVEGVRVTPDHPPIGKVGALIETPGFFENLSGEKNLLFLNSLSGGEKGKVYKALDLVGLERTKKPVKAYSLGMKQRLGLAQVLMEDCPVLILDEPMNSLDAEAVETMKEKILSLKEKERTILMASHVYSDIDHLCDCVIYLSHGKVEKIETKSL